MRQEEQTEQAVKEDILTMLGLESPDPHTQKIVMLESGVMEIVGSPLTFAQLLGAAAAMAQ